MDIKNERPRTPHFWLPALTTILLVSRLGIGFAQESQWFDPSPVPRSEEDVPGFGTASESVIRDLFQLMKEEERTNSAAFRSAVHKTRVIEIPGAKHYLFLSNEEDVLRAIRAFMAGTR
jgi:hypothetical protein